MMNSEKKFLRLGPYFWIECHRRQDNIGPLISVRWDMVRAFTAPKDLAHSPS